MIPRTRQYSGVLRHPLLCFFQGAWLGVNGGTKDLQIYEGQAPLLLIRHFLTHEWSLTYARILEQVFYNR